MVGVACAAMTDLAGRESVKSDVNVMQRDLALFYDGVRHGQDEQMDNHSGRRLRAMGDVVLDRLVAVTIGAILIALGAFAINDPAAVRASLSGVFPFSRVPFTDDHVRIAGAMLVLAAAVWVVAALLLPFRVTAPMR